MIEGFGLARLEIKFDVDQPVELVQLTLALQALGETIAGLLMNPCALAVAKCLTKT